MKNGPIYLSTSEDANIADQMAHGMYFAKGYKLSPVVLRNRIVQIKETVGIKLQLLSPGFMDVGGYYILE